MVMKRILALICALALVKADPVRTNLANYNEADPKQAPIICALPNSDGVLVAHEHCNQFYQCWDGKPIARSCSETLHYNTDTEVCDWPNNVDCGTRAIPEAVPGHEHDHDEEVQDICLSEGSEGLLIPHKSCNKFYKCHEGKLESYKCPGNLLYSAALGYCNCADVVDCGDRISEGEIDNENGEDNSSQTENSDPSKAPEICASDGSDGVLVAHENCNKFYKCSNGEPVELKCFGNLMFDSAQGHCEWPEKVDCGDRIIPECDDETDTESADVDENETETNETEDNDESEIEGQGNCDPSQAENICATEGSDGTLVAHEICNKYYICSHRVPVTQSCPGTLLFNPSKSYCDWPENVECGDRIIPEDNGTGGGDNGATDNESSENESNDNGSSENGGSGTCNCNPAEASDLCAADGSDGVLVAHENCNQFYTCVSGRPITQSCASGTLYNPYTQQCDWPENVECGDRVIPEDNGTGGGDNDNGATDNESSENDNGSSENGGSGTCNCNPAEASDLCAADGSDGVLVAHENCNQFYTCVAGRPVTQSCASGTLYNPYTQQCDWPENVECGDRVIPEDNGTGGGDNDNGATDNESSENDNGSSENGGSGTCNCNPAEASDLCAADGSDGVLVAHENCNQFYTCVAGRPVTQSCASGTLYNPYTQQCDWPENVECGDRVIPEDNGTGGGDNDNGATDNESSENDNGSSENGGSGTCNCNPAEASDLCAADGSDGVLVAHENCNQFYTCVAGRPVTQSCASGTLYNPYTQQCDWPENVECGDRVIPEDNVTGGGDNGATDNESSENGSNDNGSSENGGSGTCNCNPAEASDLCAADGSDGVLVAHENCNQFYTCVSGRPITQSCASGTLYNPYTQQCDWPENVECGDRVIPEDNGTGGGDNDNGATDNESSENDNGSSENGGSGTCNCNPAEASDLCAVDGSDGVLVAHENCNQFYTCVAGRPVTQSCASGTLYNPYTQQCDWPENVECGDRVIPEDNGTGGGDNGATGNESSENGSNDNGSSENGGSGACNCNPAEASDLCAADGSDGVLVAHENCNQFYTCVAGRPVTQSCASGTLYNPYTQQCDWPENVECGDRVIPEDNGTGGGDNGATDNESSENGSNDNGSSENGGSGACNCNPAEASDLCAADGSDGVLVAHENCNQFYTCVSGRPVTQSCASGTLYNPYTQQCDWPENVECGERVIPEDNGAGGGDNGATDNESSENGSSESGVSGTCNCNPAEASDLCAADGSDGVLVAHENCNQFYTCVSGRPVTQTCATGTFYNPYTQQCDWPENVQCGERVIPEDCEEDNNDGSEEDNNNEKNDNESSDSESNETCNCNPAEAPELCAADGSDGVLVAHENCNQFYTCVAGKPVAQSCSSGTLYNPHTQQCDWPDNVQCGERVIPEDCEEDNNDGSEGDNSNENNDNESSDSESNETCNCNPAEAPELCAADGSDGVLVAHENCNQFYTCVAGKPVAQSCSSGTLYNPYTQQCDWPDNVKCGERVILEDCDEDNSDVSEENNSNENETGENGDNGVCNCNPAEAPEICAADGSDGLLVAHENCNQFYTCIGSRPTTLSCASGTLYNPYTEQCDWPDNVQCGERVIPEDCDDENGGIEGEGNGNENEGIENGSSETCNCNPSEAPEICATDGSDGILVAHENCNQFYTCVGGKPVTQKCAGITLYNPYTQQCDWPDNVVCENRIISENCEEDSNVSQDSGSEDSGSEENIETGNCNCNPSEAPEICAAEGTDGVFVAHENCKQFYTCVDGKPVTITCAGITLYNPYTERCDWPDNVSCGERIMPEDSNTDSNVENEIEEESSENQNNENEEDSVITDTDVSEICARSGSEGLFLPHDNCNQFYVCIQSEPVIMNCSGALLYNPQTDQCDWPDNVNCGTRAIPSDASEKHFEEDDEIKIIDVQAEDNESEYVEETEENAYDVAVRRCGEQDSAGVQIPHEECHRFYVCLSSRPIVFTCTSNYLYDTNRMQCNYPENVDCGNRIVRQL